MIQLPDLVNGLFESLGGIAICGNVIKIYKDKMVRGVNLKSVLFFTLWGGYNLYFYPHLNQWCSFVGGLSIFVANAIWITLAWKYRKA